MFNQKSQSQEVALENSLNKSGNNGLKNSARRALGLLAAGVFVAAGVAAPLAQARVELVNEVHKVDRYVDDKGRVQRRLVEPNRVIPGDELRYSVRFTNVGDQPVDAGSVVITNPVPGNTEYLEGTAAGDSAQILYSVDAGAQFGSPSVLRVTENGSEAPANASDYTTIRWVYAPGLEPGATGTVSFNVRLK